MCQQAGWPEGLQCRQMPWTIFRMERPFMACALGQYRSSRLMFLGQIHFPQTSSNMWAMEGGEFN